MQVAKAAVFVAIVALLTIVPLFVPPVETVETVETVEIVFIVDGKQCWMDIDPELHYRPKQQTVALNIRCDYTVLDAHLPAIERTQ